MGNKLRHGLLNYNKRKIILTFLERLSHKYYIAYVGTARCSRQNYFINENVNNWSNNQFTSFVIIILFIEKLEILILSSIIRGRHRCIIGKYRSNSKIIQKVSRLLWRVEIYSRFQSFMCRRSQLFTCRTC